MIGRTPLVRLHQFEREMPGVELYAKAEWQNPGGSVKDRAAARMILEGEASGALTPDNDHHRRDLGQHRHRLRDGRRGARLQGEAVHAGKRQPRAQADSARARRRAGAHRSAREHRRRDSRSAAAVRRGSGPLLLSGPVQQRRQLARALRHDRAGDHRADQRPPDALRRRPRHQRHVRRHGTPAAEVQPGDQADLVSAARGRFTASKG